MLRHSYVTVMLCYVMFNMLYCVMLRHGTLHYVMHCVILCIMLCYVLRRYVIIAINVLSFCLGM